MTECVCFVFNLAIIEVFPLLPFIDQMALISLCRYVAVASNGKGQIINQLDWEALKWSSNHRQTTYGQKSKVEYLTGQSRLVLTGAK